MYILWVCFVLKVHSTIRNIFISSHITDDYSTVVYYQISRQPNQIASFHFSSNFIIESVRLIYCNTCTSSLKRGDKDKDQAGDNISIFKKIVTCRYCCHCGSVIITNTININILTISKPNTAMMLVLEPLQKQI